jgi:hypothetical protein
MYNNVVGTARIILRQLQPTKCIYEIPCHRPAQHVVPGLLLPWGGDDVTQYHTRVWLQFRTVAGWGVWLCPVGDSFSTQHMPLCSREAHHVLDLNAAVQLDPLVQWVTEHMVVPCFNHCVHETL